MVFIIITILNKYWNIKNIFISKIMNNHDKLIKQIFFTDQFKINNSNNIKYKKNKNTKYNNICKYLSTTNYTMEIDICMIGINT